MYLVLSVPTLPLKCAARGARYDMEADELTANNASSSAVKSPCTAAAAGTTALACVPAWSTLSWSPKAK